MASSAPAMTPMEVARGGDRVIAVIGRVREFGLIIALLVIVIVVRVQAPRFTSVNNIRAILVASRFSRSSRSARCLSC